MDFFAHAAWSFIVFHRSMVARHRYYAMFFGVLPDLLSWFIYLVYMLVSGGSFGAPQVGNIPAWVFTLYGISHSLIIAGIVMGFLWVIYRSRFPLFVLMWPMHILIDIPTHSRNFLPTPFLYPFSDWHFPGISWGEPWFMILNWSLILVCFGVIWWNSKKKNKLKQDKLKRTLHNS